jgi:short-subunit dehydrogenase
MLLFEHIPLPEPTDMRLKLKPLNQQVIVITGATSGIGLATARFAARKGASLMLIARDERALKKVANELSARGAIVAYAAADVGDEVALQRAADAAVAHFGGFDTWVNNAGGSVYGFSEEVPLEDQRKLFETNFWGVVHGSLIAVRHLKKRGGGALINLGSELSDVAVPLQGSYVASKHAVKGYTDTLRLELINEGAPVSVTLIKPAGIDTLFVQHARNHLDVEPKLPPPVYAPDIVAKAILHAATRPEREIYVGGASRGTVAFGRAAPGLFDRFMGTLGVAAQMTKEPKRNGDALYEGAGSLLERSGKNGPVLESSLYTRARLNQRATAGVMLAGAAALLIASMAKRYVNQSRV